MPTSHMTPDQRLQLVQLACIAAWSDLEVRPEERAVVLDIVATLNLPEGTGKLVEGWLADGPPDLDPYSIPREHRDSYMRAFLEVVTADGRIDLEESETIRVLRELLA